MAFCPKPVPLNPTKMRLLCGPEPSADNLGPHKHPIHVLLLQTSQAALQFLQAITACGLALHGPSLS